jgi:hypothetical protein
MKSAVVISFLSATRAFTHDKVAHIPHQAVLRDACPSDSMLVDRDCATHDPSSTLPSTVVFGANVSHPSLTLSDSRKMASQTPDFPWTFWPECFSVEDSEEPYCVFSDQTFASGRGIFIVTTKTLAYAMREKAAFVDPQVLEAVNQHDFPPFIQHDFPGKGRGLLANKTLQRGSVIFASTPLLITDPDLHDLNNPERLALLHRGVDTLPADSQTLFWKLMGHTDADAVDDRITTNNFEVSIDGISQSALFPEIAMLNHDCRPNAVYAFDQDTMTHYVHAIREIRPGEEITISYIDNETDRATRMGKLERLWGFKCDCAACTANPALVAESDSRLQHVAVLTKALDDWTVSSAATPEMAELLISLFEQERLSASLAMGYKHAAEVYSSFGRRWEAMKYARKSTELNMLDKGFKDADVAEMRKMALQPEMSWSWKKRVGMGEKAGCGCGHVH